MTSSIEWDSGSGHEFWIVGCGKKTNNEKVKKLVEDTEKQTSQSHGAVFFCSSPPNSLQWRRTQQASNPFFTIITSTSNIIGMAKLKGMLLQPKLNHFLNEIGFLSGFGWGFQALCFRPHLNSHSTDTCRRRLELSEILAGLDPHRLLLSLSLVMSKDMGKRSNFESTGPVASDIQSWTSYSFFGDRKTDTEGVGEAAIR
ncbi:unnamed protein product [Prunus armeniaca]|uniref:Uncharacterized protein n=1 Tax=Prunus armeniaca TaxID=36596 RepID=A0A6J5V589_PRUAR|nr:unnamed protein product [Prunus armeniaca]